MGGIQLHAAEFIELEIAFMDANPFLRKEDGGPPAVFQLDGHDHAQKDRREYDQAHAGQENVNSPLEPQVDPLSTGQFQVCLLFRCRSRHIFHIPSNFVSDQDKITVSSTLN